MNYLRTIFDTFPAGIWGSNQTNPDEFRYGARISVWVRWVVLLFCLIEANYRVEYGSVSQILNTLYVIAALAFNGCVHYRIWSNKTVGARWLLALSFIDVAMITFSTSLSSGLGSRYFVLYYFEVAFFAAVFMSTRLNLLWVTMVAGIYTTVSILVAPGIDFEAHQEQALLYRIGILYGVAGIVNLITRVERIRGREALEREVELHRQRSEISQTIHDTTAQSAYMMGLGIETALEIAGDTNDELTDKLHAMAELSRSIMWELRHPIDGGQIFRGKELGQLLRLHASTFTDITSVPAELVQLGIEPPLSAIERSQLFSIAHNALTNAFRHARATSVVIILDSEADRLKMSVSDDGIGLPDSYDDTGHGFRNMRVDAERMGGWIEVRSGHSEDGTTVTCVFPYNQ